MNFERFIENKFPGLNFLSISDERYLPAAVINDEDRIIDSLSRIFPAEPATKWKYCKVESRIQGETIQGTRNLEFGAKFLGVVGLKAGVSAGYSVSFEFDKATSVVFDTEKGGIYENEARELIRRLKQSSREQWKELLHEFITMESVFVESFKIKLSRDGKVLTEADVQTHHGEISIASTYTWSASGEMVIKNNNTPFGLRGFQVKRHM